MVSSACSKPEERVARWADDRARLGNPEEDRITVALMKGFADPEWDARAALRRQRFGLIMVGSGWGGAFPLGIYCATESRGPPDRPLLQRRGTDAPTPDEEAFRKYAETYNRIIVSSTTYPYRAECQPRSG